MISGLNHITLAVSNLETSLMFYTQTVGFKALVKWKRGAYLSLADLWLCLSCDHPSIKTDYSHIAFSIDDSDFEAYCLHLEAHKVLQWKVNKSEGKSFYFLDPDGHKLEVHVGNLATRLNSLKLNPYEGLVWL